MKDLHAHSGSVVFRHHIFDDVTRNDDRLFISPWVHLNVRLLPQSKSNDGRGYFGSEAGGNNAARNDKKV